MRCCWCGRRCGFRRPWPALDTKGIDWLADGAARLVAGVARLDDWIDRLFVDGLVNLTARGTYAVGLRLRAVQTGNVRQYVMLVVVGTVVLFVLTSFLLELRSMQNAECKCKMQTGAFKSSCSSTHFTCCIIDNTAIGLI